MKHPKLEHRNPNQACSSQAETRRLADVGFCSLLCAICFSATAQPTAFTYQGRLNDGPNPANGVYDLLVVDYDAPTGGYSTTFNLVTNIGVTNGLFTVQFDLTALTFPGADRWLELGVRTNGGGAFTFLSPRQRVTSAPYAIRAASAATADTAVAVPAANVTGTLAFSQLPAAILTNNQGSISLAGTFTGTFTGNGAGLTNLNAWSLAGNAGTTPGVNFIGTTDNQPVEVRANNLRALRIEPRSGGVPAIIGGFSGNSAHPFITGPTIGGGGDVNFTNYVSGAYGTIGGGRGNQAGGFFSTVSGGSRNSAANSGATVGGGADNTATNNFATVAGGESNLADGSRSTIGGGMANQAIGFGATVAGGVSNESRADYAGVGAGYDNLSTNSYSYIGGGRNNRAGGFESVVAGGLGNRALGNVSVAGGGQENIASGIYSTVGGGYQNTASGNTATVAGGQNNMANGNYSTISGGFSNAAPAIYSTVGGGRQNIASNAFATVVGGWQVKATGDGAFAGGGGVDGGSVSGNLASGPASVVVGGLGNTASGIWSMVGGGRNNTADGTNASVLGGDSNQASGQGSVVGGGGLNEALANYSLVSGGYANIARGIYATIPGGRDNTATNYAFAAGRRAKANHTGAFVWADSTDADFTSTTSNQFNLRATGGVRLSDNTPALFFGETTRQMINLWRTNFAIGVQDNTTYFRSLGRFSWFFGGSHTNTENSAGSGGSVGMTLTSGGLTVNGTFVSASDRNVKTDFHPVNPQVILEKVAALPLSEWRYQADEQRSRHLGPMAQDFHAAFGLGANDTTIATVDADGVALAAIQGLNAKVESGKRKAESEIADLRAENAALKARLKRLEQLLESQLNGGAK